jgi:hypothetical protein
MHFRFLTRERLFTFEMCRHLDQVFGTADIRATRQRGLEGVGRRQNQRTPGQARLQCHGERAEHGPQLARERQFADEFVLLQVSGRNLPGGGEDGDGEVEAPALLRQIGGARLMVIRRAGNSKRAFCSAARTRSLLSMTAVSGRPTMERFGRPLARCTSTVTGGASMPTWARL